jgi:hypothetical protein
MLQIRQSRTFCGTPTALTSIRCLAVNVLDFNQALDRKRSGLRHERQHPLRIGEPLLFTEPDIGGDAVISAESNNQLEHFHNKHDEHSNGRR